MRFDMRAPAFGAPTSELYRAALEMAAFAESRGAITAVISEHHTMADGYLPSPLVLATAMAARTTTLPITTGTLILPLYDPIRLAEDMAVLDIISGGRVSYILAIGYRPEEYEQHGVDFHHRGRLADEQLALLLQAKTGEPFEHHGRRIHVTPPPVTPGGPRIMWGGGSPAAARRAARFGLDFLARGGGPAVEEAYLAEAKALGRPPGFCMVPSTDIATTVFVADDVDAAWDEFGPHLVHDVTAYAALNPGNTHTASLSTATTVDELRAEDRTHRIIGVSGAIEMVRAGTPLQLHPLVGGLAPARLETKRGLMAIRVVQWTTGNVGKESVKAIVANPTLELVGCFDDIAVFGPAGVDAKARFWPGDVIDLDNRGYLAAQTYTATRSPAPNSPSGISSATAMGHRSTPSGRCCDERRASSRCLQPDPQRGDHDGRRAQHPTALLPR